MPGTTPPTRIALVGAGAFGVKHLDALAVIEDAELAAVVTPERSQADALATRYGAATAATDLAEVLKRDDIDAVVLCTPTPLHAEQAIAVMRAGKDVEVEIPLADSWADAEAVAETQRDTGRICMVGHTRRFNPSHRWIRQRIAAGGLRLQHLDVRTHFLRRSNLNALNQPRTWTDHLLWHHAAHTVDLLRFQTGEDIVTAHAIQGPPHPELGIAMDMSIQLRTEGGTVCTLSLSFNNDGPFGSVFRYIGDTGTYVARYDDLVTGRDEPVDLSGTGCPANGIEGQDRAFVAAVRAGREPESGLAAVLDSYRVLARLERQLIG
ncbi:Gfo/Idh/MocA family oxidoreductase [Streptomyces sp. NPDC059477]|uniref:Gfo/Idh/MocA family oxidoreductase n=1 Tax=Streptomyces sp. NPDC059477 TaxID=3346847 RepID=UPI0036A9BF5A